MQIKRRLQLSIISWLYELRLTKKNHHLVGGDVGWLVNSERCSGLCNVLVKA